MDVVPRIAIARALSQVSPAEETTHADSPTRFWRWCRAGASGRISLPSIAAAAAHGYRRRHPDVFLRHRWTCGREVRLGRRRISSATRTRLAAYSAGRRLSAPRSLLPFPPDARWTTTETTARRSIG